MEFEEGMGALGKGARREVELVSARGDGFVLREWDEARRWTGHPEVRVSATRLVPGLDGWEMLS